MRRFQSALLAAVAIIGFASVASAADMPTKAYYKAPIVPPQFSWTGAYVGIDAGYFWASASASVPALSSGTATTHPDSFTFGGHLGYLYQFSNPLVVGVEGDVSWLNGKDNSLFPLFPVAGMIANSKWDASARGILGYAFDMNLVYVTGGASWVNGSGCGAFAATPTTCIAGSNVSATLSGWTVGGGFAHAFTPNVIARVEYLYADYGTNGFTNGIVGAVNVPVTTNKLRAGVSWKF